MAEGKRLEITPSLKAYIEEKILPLYEKNEEGHGISHIKIVTEKSLRLAADLEVDCDMVYTVAAYHDLGHHIDRKNHEKISAELFREDRGIRRWFSPEQRLIIEEAIEDHRASGKREPRSIYGKIISTADRSIGSIDTIIMRTYSYGRENQPGLSWEQQLDRVYAHLADKYGEGGYARVPLRDEELEKSLEELRAALKDKAAFYERIKNVIAKSKKSD